MLMGIQRDEKDLVQLQSGLEHGITLGTPIGLLVKNEDQRPRDYSEVKCLHCQFLPIFTLDPPRPIFTPAPATLIGPTSRNMASKPAAVVDAAARARPLVVLPLVLSLRNTSRPYSVSKLSPSFLQLAKLSSLPRSLRLRRWLLRTMTPLKTL